MVDLKPLVEETVARYRGTESGHQFHLEVADGATVVYADSLRVEQVLDNMLSNAVKYAPEGGEIAVAISPDPYGVTLTVTDHGIGLPPGTSVTGGTATATSMTGGPWIAMRRKS